MSIYMEYEGIKGEATHEKHKGWIEISTMDFSSDRYISTPSGAAANREPSEPTLSPIHLTKPQDVACTKLFIEAASGSKSKLVTIDVVKTNDPGDTYTQLILTDVLLSNFSFSTSGGLPNIMFALSYTKIQYKIIPYDKDNKAGSPVTVGYDIATTKSS